MGELWFLLVLVSILGPGSVAAHSQSRDRCRVSSSAETSRCRLGSASSA